MKRMRKIHFGFVSLVALWLALAAPLADKAGANEPWVVRVVSVQGVVEARKAGTAHWFVVKINDTFQPGDMIRLHENSRASVALPNETILRLDQNTTITFLLWRNSSPGSLTFSKAPRISSAGFRGP